MQTNKWKKDDPRFDTYIQQLKSHGLEVHPALRPAIFTLNNGLEYPGLRVQGQVIAPTTLVTVPTTLLLTSHKARQQPSLLQVFTHPFYNTGQLWQDRILITYLLYVFQQKDQKNIWYHMVQVFSKQVDILSFWSQDQIDQFSDKSVKRAAKLERKNYEKQWTQFEQVKQEHEQFFGKYSEEAFGKENYQWIYTHAVSRCFGSFMNSTYFTPFCEFFNHHCVNVSYQCVTQQEHQAQIKKNSQTLKKEMKQTEEQKYQNEEKNQDKEDQSEISSISSGNSIDYIEDGDFNYWEIESYKIKWGGKISFDLKEKETKEIQKFYNQGMDLLEKSIVWSGYNYIFMGQVIQKLHIIKNQYMAGRKKFVPAKEAFQHTKTIVKSYKSQVVSYYRTMGHKYNPKPQKQSTIDDLSTNNQSTTQPSVYQKTSQPPKKPYRKFLMQADSNAKFSHKEQIYFCYGNISNRTMLTRYGFCIEDNAQIEGLIDILQIENQTSGLAILALFVAKTSEMIFYPHDLQQQIDIFQNMQQILKQRLPEFTSYPKYQDLNDPSISYHQYFIRVYHKEKARILQKQLEMLEFVKKKLNEMYEAKRIIPCKQFKAHQFKKQLKGYWKILQKGMIVF